MTNRPHRLLTVGHSYVVALNRRLPHEIARISSGKWDVTVVAPPYVRAELRNIALERDAQEMCHIQQVNAYATKHLHVMAFDWRLRGVLHQGWDMIHIYQEPYIFSGWQAAFWSPSRAPYVFFTNQNNAKKYPPPFSWMEEHCVNRCAGWIGCGELVVEALLKKNYGRKPHRLIGFGVDTEVFRPDPNRRNIVRQKLGWDDSIPVVAFLGRLVPEKGLELLCSVLETVRSRWRALFIGSGPMKPYLEAWKSKYPDNVRIVGPDHGDVPGYLNAADILCTPSQTTASWREQFGRMIVEGFASGLAVVGSDSGEIPFVIGDAGLIVGEKDQSAWSCILERLLDDHAFRGGLSQRGRARAMEHFSWPVIARKHIEFFEQIIDAKNGGPRPN